MRVLYAEFAVPLWVRLARRLHEVYGVEPVAWTALASLRDEIQAAFPTCQFFDLADIKRNIFPESQRMHEHGPFDAVCQRVWNEYAQLMYDQYHRWDRSADFSTLERTEHFYEALVFWNAYVESAKPDAIFFRNAPHGLYDLLLLAIARVRGIRTLMFHHTAIPPYSIVTNDLDRGRNPHHEGIRMARWELQAGRPLATESELSPSVRAEIQKMRQSYDKAVPWFQAASLQALHEKWSLRRVYETAKELIRHFRRDLKEWRRGNVKPPYSPINRGSIAKERGRTLRESYTGVFPRFSQFLNRIRERRAVFKIRTAYHKAAHWDDSIAQKPFVYLALSFQPEATTNPHGGIFAQQILMVNLLAHALPPGWTLVVREHPAQFRWDFIGQVSRNEEYYRLIAAIPGVVLAPLEMDPFKLMDACTAVTTIVGTTGWEALVRGKPVLVFGDIWYDRCRGAFRVRTLEDARAALRTIAAGGAAPTLPDVIDYARELEFSAFTAGGELEVCPPEVVTSVGQIEAMADRAAEVLGLASQKRQRISLRALTRD